MLAGLVDAMGEGAAEPPLQLEHAGRRRAEVHDAVRLPQHVAVAGMQIDDLDPVVLRGQHPMPDLGGRPPAALPGSRASLRRRRAQHRAYRRRGGESRRRQPPTAADPFGHGPAILAGNRRVAAPLAARPTLRDLTPPCGADSRPRNPPPDGAAGRPTNPPGSPRPGFDSPWPPDVVGRRRRRVLFWTP